MPNIKLQACHPEISAYIFWTIASLIEPFDWFIFLQIDNNFGQSKPFTFNQVFSHKASQGKVRIFYNCSFS